MLFIKFRRRIISLYMPRPFCLNSFILVFAFIFSLHHIRNAKTQYTQLLLSAQQSSRACETGLRESCGRLKVNLFRLRPWGMWQPGEGRCLFKKVFNSTTVYLRNRWGRGEGKRCHPCLNFVVRGYFDCCHHLCHAFILPHGSCL